MSNNSYKLIKLYPKCNHEIGTIIPKGGMGWMCIYSDLENGLYHEFWEKVKEPIFTTEDNVEVFEEGNFFIIDTDYNQEGACYFAWSIEKLFIKNKSDLPVSSCVKIFSTEKAAKEYIDLNKPRFSKKDLLDASINIQYGGWFIEGLIKRLNK